MGARRLVSLIDTIVGGALTLVGGILLSAVATGTIPQARAQEQAPSRRSFSVEARKYAFDPPRIVVTQDDIVRITFSAVDIPHSFTVDAYRIAKRSNPDHAVTFEFHAIQPGSFPIYCNLSIDDGCREIRGELVVQPQE